ncbi:MAG: class I tRNA ligase family protein, partial [Planctomycetota bacterium]
IKKITESFSCDFKFNTCVSAIMTLLNSAEETFTTSDIDEVTRKVLKEFISNIIVIIAPFTPYLAEELNERMGEKMSVFRKKWPSYSQKALMQEIVEIVIQFNGKFRGTIKVSLPVDKEKLFDYVKSNEKFKKYFENKQVKDIIYVENKLINIVCQ